ncbi:MAG: 23S rRNA (uracil(1939)-C(5))-methyltransferase RlmD [Peptostreptococcales bacterium]
MDGRSPIEKNKQYGIEIIDMGHSGEGIGKVNNFTIFVEKSVIGDKLIVEITTLKKNYAIGEIVEYLEASPFRIEAKCPIFNECGGCQIQNMHYEKQLELKKKIVVDSLERIGGIENPPVEDTIGMNDPYRYRNKGQFPVGWADSKMRIGFYAKKSHEIIDCESCLILYDKSDEIIAKMRRLITKHAIQPYSEVKGKGFLRHLVIKQGYKTDEIMVILVTNGRDFKGSDAFVKDILREIPEITSLVQNINTKKSNVILGGENIVLHGNSYIRDFIKELEFKISPHSFFQVNPEQTEKLYATALSYADLKGDEIVFDLYSGIGTISLFLAQKAKKVIGVEIVEEAVKDARENAKLNRISNAEFFVGKAEDVVPELYKEGYRADIVVVDPPRKGCDNILLDTMIKMNPKKIIYVSCNPATLARDVKRLVSEGYRLTKVQPVDMFPHGMHVEVTTLLQRVVH